MLIVEIGGVEPPSKQGTNMLSTCLSPPSFSCLNKTGATNSDLICSVFSPMHRSLHRLFRVFPHLFTLSAHRLGLERCLVSAPGAEIRLIYCTSIKQREHSYCCQLIVIDQDLRASSTVLGMLTYLFYLLSKPNIPVYK